jgi:hypothetical protein
MVHLVEVNVISFETFQAGFTGVANVIGAKASIVRAVTHPTVDFGCQHDFLAPPTLLEPTPNDFFGKPKTDFAPVNIGGIKKIDATLERRVHDFETVSFRSFWTKIHGAKAETADF